MPAAAVAAAATASITPRRETRSETDPIGSWNTIPPTIGAPMNRAVWPAERPERVAYTAPIPSRAPADIPDSADTVTPVGTSRASWTTDIGSGIQVGGALAPDNATGTRAREIRTEAITNNSKPSGAAMFKRN